MKEISHVYICAFDFELAYLIFPFGSKINASGNFKWYRLFAKNIRSTYSEDRKFYALKDRIFLVMV